MRRTPLYDWHVELEARMVPFGGWEMPVQYSGIVEEHHGTRQAAGLFDTCHMGEIRLCGPGAAGTLAGVLTRPVDDLPVGQGRYAMMCAEDGTVIDDTITFRLGEEDFWVVVNAGTREDDFRWIEKHATAECELTDESDTTAKLDLQGPHAETILSALCESPAQPAGIPRFGLADGSVAGIPVRVARAGYTGEDGFEIFCDPSRVVDLAGALKEAGTPRGLVVCGLGARDTLRLEAGLPLYGHELSRERPANASGMRWAIDLQSDFVGRDQLGGDPEETLVAFRMEGRRAAREGDRLLSVDENRPIGIVTSGSYCPTLGFAAGLAYVEQAHAAPGTPIGVELRGKNLPAKIEKKPLYKRGLGA